MSPELRQRIQTNLFPAAHASVEPWDEFPWHLNDRTKECDTWKPHSSQAMAIDVFGTLAVLPQKDRDAILDDIAEQFRMPAGGPWSVQLEWTDPQNELREIRPTQVDVVAEGARSQIFFEVKFTERSSGCCSQVNPLTRGPNQGVVQCDGNYAWQTNPYNGVQSRCALSGKGIRYWDHLPRLFQLDPDAEWRPCPFAGPLFQLMRNVVLCDVVARRKQLAPCCIVAYVDDPLLSVAQWIGSGALAFDGPVLNQPLVPLHAVTMGSVCSTIARYCEEGKALADWVERKVATVVGGSKL